MRMYGVALIAGVVVGIFYGCIGVRSPAPPVVALIGLFGILLGEQIVPATKRWLAGHRIDVTWVRSDCAPHVFGQLPSNPSLHWKKEKVPHECKPDPAQWPFHDA
jgi:XapX domain-containing protein